MSTTGYANQDFVQDAHTAIKEDRQAEREKLEEIEETRESLESNQPISDNAESAEADMLADSEMTPGRRIGIVDHTIDGQTYQFGKPSGRSTKTMLRPITRMDREGASLPEMADYVWALLAEWSIDGRYDVDYWADEVSMVDALQLARSVAMGGNAQRLGR